MKEYPWIAEKYSKMKTKYLQLCSECDEIFASIMKSHGGSGKEFADEVNKQKNYAIIFGIKKYGTTSNYLSAADTFPEVGIQRRLEHLLFEEEPLQLEFSQNEDEESFV